MFSTNTRNTIMALVASFSVAGMTVVPTAAQAQVFKPRGPSATCKKVQEWYDHDYGEYFGGLVEGNKARAKHGNEQMKLDEKIAKNEGCNLT